MTSHNFEDASEEFLELKLDLERLLRDKLPYAQRESRKLLMNDISRKFEIAQSSLNEMQREIEKAYVSARPQLSYKLRTYQTELSALKRQVDQEVRRYQREQSSNPFDKPDVTRNQVLRNQDAVDRATAAVHRTEVIAVETENIGNEITTELGNQRDQLVRTRDKLEETNTTLDKSRRTILTMGRKAITNKALLIVIIVLEVLMLGGVLYLKFKKKK